MTSKTSIVWKYFKEESNDSVKCSLCSKIYSRRGRGTSSLKNHLRSMHIEQFKQMILEEANQNAAKEQRKQSCSAKKNLTLKNIFKPQISGIQQITNLREWIGL